MPLKRDNMILYLVAVKGSYYATLVELSLYSIQELLKIHHKQSIDIDLQMEFEKDINN